MVELLGAIVIIALCVLAEGFFSGSETAIVSLDRSRLAATGGLKHSRRIRATLAQPERFFATTLLGTNACAIFANAIATLLIIRQLGPQWEYLTVVVMSPLILIAGEMVPKTLYHHYAEQVAPRVIMPLQILGTILAPITGTLSALTRGFLSLCGMPAHTPLQPALSRTDLTELLAFWGRDTRLKLAEKQIIERIFNLGSTEAGDIMIPLVKTRSIDSTQTVADAIAEITASGHTRIPVFQDEPYHIIGVLHAFDLLDTEDHTAAASTLMRPARYVPESADIETLLRRMRVEGTSLAIVVDEYGGSIGIITVEDILEEMVGEIYDEYDSSDAGPIAVGDGAYQVPGTTTIDMLLRQLGIELPRGEYDTLAGCILKELGRIPRTGETFRLHDLECTIQSADRRRIKQVRLKIPPRPDTQPPP